MIVCWIRFAWREGPRAERGKKLLGNIGNNLCLQVLCELQVALVERQLSSRPDATRDIMKSEFRNMSSSETFRNLRDWLIFRDYMNGLEYVVQVFEHLRRGLQS